MVDGLRLMQKPRLIGWAVHTDDLEAVQKRATATGLTTENLRDGSRTRPDGKMLHWKSFNLHNDFAGVLPFFIQWSAGSIHPSEDAPGGCSLQHLSIESPAATDVKEAARNLGLELEIRRAMNPALKARIQGKKGAFELD